LGGAFGWHCLGPQWGGPAGDWKLDCHGHVSDDWDQSVFEVKMSFQ
jgi:hypothetical protein